MEHRICGNCNGAIAVQNFLTHEAYCTRSLVKCSVCDEMIRRSKVEEHLSEAHATAHCERCSEPYQKSDEIKHKDCCSMRPISCEFCDLVLPMISMPDHRSNCGCRTELCSGCKKFVMARERSSHVCSSEHSIYHHSDEKHTGSSANLESDFDFALRLQCLELGSAAAVAAAVADVSNCSRVDDPSSSSTSSQPTKNTKNGSKSDVENKTLNPPSSHVPAEVLIPCELCSESYQISEISIHEAQCCRVPTPYSPTGLPKLPSECESDSTEPLMPNRFVPTKSVTQQAGSVTNSGDTPPTQHPVCLSRPGKISELRPVRHTQRHSFRGLGEGTSNQSNATGSNGVVRHPTTRPAYNLPPIKDPKIQRRKFSVSGTGDSGTRTSACVSSNVPKFTTRPQNLSNYSKQRNFHVCACDMARTSAVNSLRPVRSRNISGNVFRATTPPRQSFPGMGRRLGDH